MKISTAIFVFGLPIMAAGLVFSPGAYAQNAQSSLSAGEQGGASDLLLEASAKNNAAGKVKSSAAHTGPEKFVDMMASDAISFLGSNMSQEQKRAAFRKLLEQSFDMNTIGRFTLGTYWRQATPEQQAEYQTLFKRRVINIYSDRFQEYKGQTFETRGSRKETDQDTIVTSYIMSPEGGSEVRVDWRVRDKGGKYAVVDVIVEGVSMSVTQRSDFASVIQRGGGNIEVLLKHLRGK